MKASGYQIENQDPKEKVAREGGILENKNMNHSSEYASEQYEMT
jgi:hypothetical protein